MEAKVSKQRRGLAAALVKVQLKMKPALRRSLNESVGNAYADLEAVLEACGKLLAANDIALSHQVKSNPEGVTVTTELEYAPTGEKKSTEVWLPVLEKTPQGYGSAITYARRYGLGALLGIATKDDDGNAAAPRQPAPELAHPTNDHWTAIDAYAREVELNPRLLWPLVMQATGKRRRVELDAGDVDKVKAAIQQLKRAQEAA